ncbi:DM13 domain-containing protein [Flammeovirga sp. MY04]|uniref:DM13 domain-containing protein n=1 Tax=Flammeovirga sp. MY04 TaxID=1191459 RepID=UPI0008062E02|nr:DM13 domain-containing protein [Flammeovirga sp. MY04]ANQ51340.1 DM13 domain-containing protein [Flammeovirga sp. MY04]
MKKLLYFIFLAFTLTMISCNDNEKPDALSEDDVLASQEESDSTAVVADENMDGFLSGTFEGSSAHPSTTGMVTLDGRQLSFNDEFYSDSGPDLFIYLAQDLEGNGFVNLGTLKSTRGVQTYEVPEDIDFTKNKYVLVWCQQFAVLFGSAELQ